MADLQQILGTMLATGMGGRSGRNTDHIGGVLGGSGMMGSGMMGMGAGRGGPGFKQTAGLAALGYLAYRAFQERQRNQASAGGGTSQPGGSPWGGAQGSQTGTSSGGGILGSIFGGGASSGGGSGSSGGGSLADRLANVFQPRATQPTASSGRDEGAFPALAMEDQQALLLIRAMITAANADGIISPDERRSVMSALDEAGAGPEERRIVEHELDNPQPVDTLLRQATDPQVAEQIYMASVMAVAEQSEAERAYLQYLASRLNIDPQRLQQIRGAA